MLDFGLRLLLSPFQLPSFSVPLPLVSMSFSRLATKRKAAWPVAPQHLHDVKERWRAARRELRYTVTLIDELPIVRVIHCLYLGLAHETAGTCLRHGLENSVHALVQQAAAKVTHVAIDATSVRVRGPLLDDEALDFIFGEAAQTAPEFLLYVNLVKSSVKNEVVHLDGFRSWSKLARLVFTVMAAQVLQLLPRMCSFQVHSIAVEKEPRSAPKSTRRARMKRALELQHRRRRTKEQSERLDARAVELGITCFVRNTFIEAAWLEPGSEEESALPVLRGSRTRALSC